MELSVREPMNFTAKDIIQSSNMELADGSNESYVKSYLSLEDFRRDTGIPLYNSRDVTFYSVQLRVSSEYNWGDLSILYDCGGTQGHMNGMFMLEGYQQSELGYGIEDGKLDSTYEYGEGKTAYFIKYQNPDAACGVYFSEKNMIFQLFVPDDSEGREIGKKIVDALAEESS